MYVEHRGPRGPCIPGKALLPGPMGNRVRRECAIGYRPVPATARRQMRVAGYFPTTLRVGQLAGHSPGKNPLLAPQTRWGLWSSCESSYFCYPRPISVLAAEDGIEKGSLRGLLLGSSSAWGMFACIERPVCWHMYFYNIPVVEVIAALSSSQSSRFSAKYLATSYQRANATT